MADDFAEAVAGARAADQQLRERHVTVDLTRDELEILIAVLLFAEGAAAVMNQPLVEVIAVLRPFRSRLVESYIRESQPFVATGTEQ